MKIHVAIKKMKKGDRISSHQAGMWEQSKSNLLYWLLIAPEGRVHMSERILKDINGATDWKIDKKKKRDVK